MPHRNTRMSHQKLRTSHHNPRTPHQNQGYPTKTKDVPPKNTRMSQQKTRISHQKSRMSHQKPRIFHQNPRLPHQEAPRKPQEHPAQGLGGDTCPPPPSFSQPLPHRSSLALRALGHPASQNLPPRGTDRAEMRNPNASPEEAELLPGVSGWGRSHHRRPSCPRAAAGGRHREPCVVRGGGRRLASRIRLHPLTVLDQGAGSQAVGVRASAPDGWREAARKIWETFNAKNTPKNAGGIPGTPRSPRHAASLMPSPRALQPPCSGVSSRGRTS